MDVKTSAQEARVMAGADLLSGYARLLPLLHQPDGGLALHWEAGWRTQTGAQAGLEPWLELSLKAVLPLVCQRCMDGMEHAVDETHVYRFVGTEEQALDEDDASDEDLLVLSREFNLRELIEDELVMALPLVPKHAQCPKELHWSAADAAFEPESEKKKQPFANLQALMSTQLPKG